MKHNNTKTGVKVMNGFIMFPLKGSFEFFPVNTIILCKAERNYIKIHLKDKSIIIKRGTLTKLMELLPPYFNRCHDSYIVNLNHVFEYQKSSKSSILLSDKQKIPISKRKKDEFESRLQNVLFKI